LARVSIREELSFTVPHNALTKQEQQKILQLQGFIAFLEQLDTLSEGTVPRILFLGEGGGLGSGGCGKQSRECTKPLP